MRVDRQRLGPIHRRLECRVAVTPGRRRRAPLKAPRYVDLPAVDDVDAAELGQRCLVVDRLAGEATRVVRRDLGGVWAMPPAGSPDRRGRATRRRRRGRPSQLFFSGGLRLLRVEGHRGGGSRSSRRCGAEARASSGGRRRRVRRAADAVGGRRLRRRGSCGAFVGGWRRSAGGPGVVAGAARLRPTAASSRADLASAAYCPATRFIHGALACRAIRRPGRRDAARAQSVARPIACCGGGCQLGGGGCSSLVAGNENGRGGHLFGAASWGSTATHPAAAASAYRRSTPRVSRHQTAGRTSSSRSRRARRSTGSLHVLWSGKSTLKVSSIVRPATWRWSIRQSTLSR